MSFDGDYPWLQTTHRRGGHEDHVNLLPDVLSEYDVDTVWDPGLVHDTCAYRFFIQAVTAESGVEYHSGANGRGVHVIPFGKKRCYGQRLDPTEIGFVHAERFDDGHAVELGKDARMTFLYVDPEDHGHPNKNTLVIRLDLGDKRVLLMGDAEGGGRADPSEPPHKKSIEGQLLSCCRDELKADVLVVGHHGSKTSSRSAFLDAVDAKTFIVSAGPTKYGRVVLPDKEVLNELENRGEVFRTDTHDEGCRKSTKKIGLAQDGKPGGCTNARVTIAYDGTLMGEMYWDFE